MNSRLLLVLLLTALFVNKSLAQSEKSSSAFTHRLFYKPFVSEISSTLNNMSFGSTVSMLPNGQNKEIFLNEIHLGIDVPFLLVE
ncbi:MAG: hypothetical protein ABJH98_12070 [Reichenbachiella sp.]|uniref:hypothetical protein n=1 Tax=Reichenbachiella sp. TaxID=2184521 RepID=UPI003296C1F7